MTEAARRLCLLEKPSREVDETFLDLVRSKPCAVCGTQEPDPHHLRTRGAGGSDLTCVPLCREHHSEWHTLGPTRFDEKYRVDLWRVNSELLAEYIRELKAVIRDLKAA